MARNAPVRLVESTVSQSSFFMRSARPSLVTAALFTRMSTGPALAKASLMDSCEDRSRVTQIDPGIVAEAASSFAASRAARITRAPADANAWAQASPMPRLAPVISAVLVGPVLSSMVKLYIMAYADLREFIRALDKHGELKRIPFEVDPELEITEFADRSVKNGGPALLFENPKGSKVPVLINAFASTKRMEIALESTADDVAGRISEF